MSQTKKPFRFDRRWREDDESGSRDLVAYEASFWEGPTEPGEQGRYVHMRVRDEVVNGRLLDTAPSVSFYGELVKACRLKVAL